MNLTSTEKTLNFDLDLVATTGCQRARESERAGDYEGARAHLSPFWQVIGEGPRLEGLQPSTQAEVLLRAGVLSGWLGSARQIDNSQEFAKDLIGQAIRRFDSLRDFEKVAESQTDLAICYWREGAMDEARVWFAQALVHAVEPLNRARVLINSTTVEISSDRLDEALNLLQQTAPLLEGPSDHASYGRYYMQLALVFKRKGGAENLDRALIENAAASFHLEQAGHTRYLARVENNIGFIQLQLTRYDHALEHLDRARRIFNELKDSGSVAQVNETRARVFLSQQRYADAENAAIAAVRTLEHGGEQSLLAEALTTHGTALARIQNYQAACDTLQRAVNLAETAGDPVCAVRARLVMIEELQHFLPAREMVNSYLEADRSIGASPDAETVNRLRAAARSIIGEAPKTSLPKAGAFLSAGSLKEAVRRYEADLITDAMTQAGGQLTRTARLLGISHQGLGEILKSRHKELRKTPLKPRRRSIIKKW
jgi:tetratricopeptide (TPR) repeat protein